MSAKSGVLLSLRHTKIRLPTAFAPRKCGRNTRRHASPRLCDAARIVELYERRRVEAAAITFLIKKTWLHRSHIQFVILVAVCRPHVMIEAAILPFECESNACKWQFEVFERQRADEAALLEDENLRSCSQLTIRRVYSRF